MGISTPAVEQIKDADIDPNSVTTDTINNAELDRETETLTFGDPGITTNSTGQSVAIGQDARALEDVTETFAGDPRTTALGYRAARDSERFALTASGYAAARDNTGSRVTAMGYRVARDNTGGLVTAMGYRAAQNNSGDDVAAIGYFAAESNTGSNVTASGFQAAANNTGNRVTATGVEAAQSNTGAGVIALGYQAAINNSKDDIMIVTDQNGNRRMELDLSNGDLSIEGSLTQNASL